MDEDKSPTCETKTQCCACQGTCAGKILWIAIIAIVIFAIYKLGKGGNDVAPSEQVSVMLLCPSDESASAILEILPQSERVKVQSASVESLKRALNSAKEGANEAEKFLERDWDCVVTLSDEAKALLPQIKGKVRKFVHIAELDEQKLKGEEKEVKAELKKLEGKLKSELEKAKAK